ncbi:MAG: hypothetical protein V3U71_14355 [Cocleimonas sp.]
MFIVRWLMGHPIIAAWVLAALAIVLNLDSTKIEEHIAVVNDETIVVPNDLVVSNVDEVLTEPKLDISNENDKSNNNQVKSKNLLEKPLSVAPFKAGDLSDASTSEMLLMAREAYWNNGLEEAAQIYLQLIEIEPKVVEYRGELGNVYWKLGNSRKAAELYSEIAMPLIKSGKMDIVNNMLSLIGQYYPERAKIIQKRLVHQ